MARTTETMAGKGKDISKILDSSSEPHVAEMSMAKKLQSMGLNGDEITLLEKIGEYYADLAKEERDGDIEKRWGLRRRKDWDTYIESKNNADSPPKERRKEIANHGRRAEDKIDQHMRGNNAYRAHCGREEHIAAMYLGLSNPKKLASFAADFFSSKAIKDPQTMAKYYVGSGGPNNNLLEVLMMLGGRGKAIAKEIAGTLEEIAIKLANPSNNSHISMPVSSVACDAARLYYYGGEAGARQIFMNRLREHSKEMHGDLNRNPKRLFLYSGSLNHGVTFAQRIKSTRDYISAALDL